MKIDFKATTFYCRSFWYRRSETPASIADRYARFMDRLAASSPLLDQWQVISRRKVTPFSQARRDLVTHVEKSMRKDQDGRPDPDEGFSLGGYTEKTQCFRFHGSVGLAYPPPSYDSLSFSTSWGRWPDLSLMTYDLFRSVTLAIIACWEPLYCATQPSTLEPHTVQDLWFRASWFTYVHPSLVHRVAPPDVPVIEPTPDGGLLLAATTDTFDADNPVHLAAALRIEAATRHLDDVMPNLWPSKT